MTETKTAPESLEYRTEVKQLLDILAHSLYTDREIFLRELISNASDALNRIQFEMLTNSDVVDADAELAIHIGYNAEDKTITISDSGIGMNHDEMIENLGTIAHSGAKAFLSEAQDKPQSLDEIIGQFGVGFYSVFMVADAVAVTSRSYRDGEEAWTWRSGGDSSYTLEPSDKESRGTEITIVLKEDAGEFANSWRLEQIVKKHSDYVSFPIYVVDEAPVEPAEELTDESIEVEEGDVVDAKPEPKPVNRQTAIWRQSASKVEEQEYSDFYKQLTFDFTDPLAHIHLVSDMPVNVRSILYVPSKRERNLMNPNSDHGLRLYSRKILIQERNRDLLPDYLRFVDGVVDSEDLPLNVSREMVQSNPVMRQLQRALTNRLLREIKEMADADPEKFATFWTEFGIFIKEGIASDPSSHESLMDLLRFHSLKNGGEGDWISLRQYVEGMGLEQSEIYYVLGEDLRSVARSPHLDTFRANDIDVLFLADPIDGFMISMMHEYDGKTLHNIDDAGLELPSSGQEDESEEPVDQEEFDELIARFKDVLGDRVIDVRESKQLVGSPCRLVSPEGDMDRDLQRLRRLMGEEFETPKKILEINRRHAIVADVSTMLAEQPDEGSENTALIDATVEQLFDNALLLEGMHPNPTDMVERIQLLMEKAVSSKRAE